MNSALKKCLSVTKKRSKKGRLEDIDMNNNVTPKNNLNPILSAINLRKKRESSSCFNSRSNDPIKTMRLLLKLFIISMLFNFSYVHAAHHQKGHTIIVGGGGSAPAPVIKEKVKVQVKTVYVPVPVPCKKEVEYVPIHVPAPAPAPAPAPPPPPPVHHHMPHMEMPMPMQWGAAASAMGNHPANYQPAYPANQPNAYPANQPSAYPANQPSAYPANQPGAYPASPDSAYPDTQQDYPSDAETRRAESNMHYAMMMRRIPMHHMNVPLYQDLGMGWPMMAAASQRNVHFIHRDGSKIEKNKIGSSKKFDKEYGKQIAIQNAKQIAQEKDKEGKEEEEVKEEEVKVNAHSEEDYEDLKTSESRMDFSKHWTAEDIDEDICIDKNC